MPFAVGIVHLGDDAAKRAVGVVAPEHRERVEDVAQHPRVGQHQHLAAVQLDAVAAQEVVQVGADRAAGIAQVIAAADAAQRGEQLGQLRRSVKVD